MTSPELAPTNTAEEVEAVLARLRAAAKNTRELGDLFERLMAAYLRADLMWSERFSDVWLWQDWPGRDGQPDTGIDLVALERDGGICAVQCKFYSPDHTLEKSDIDSFFTASGKAPFSSRLIVSTTDRWSKHAEGALERQQIPVSRLRVRDLADSPIEWSALDPLRPETVTRRPQKTLLPHQEDALANVMRGLTDAERGKLVMACGTGKTFTSLKIAEEFAAGREERATRVLFLVPSISLLSQTLREWTAEAALPLTGYAICSDTRVGRESEDISQHDLPLPATTDGATLVERVTRTRAAGDMGPALEVVFSTYQSIGAVHEAQKAGLSDFDLIICDEAHRTTGVVSSGDEESPFVRVHSKVYIRGARRLYMTATPRIYEESAKAKAERGDAVVYGMDDVDTYGEELHRLGFGEAVGKRLLTDYKVLVLAVDEQYVASAFQQQLADANSELSLDDAVKLVGCWNGLTRRQRDREGNLVIDGEPMRRAVAFSRSIKESQRVARLLEEVASELGSDDPDPVRCEAHHVDGTFNALRRNAELDWLKAPISGGDNLTRVLSNARCLSEGVDVPALDAVLFLNPRNSVVDVVQSVGRVMRRSKGKDFGYIILPIGVPADVPPEEALEDNKKYKVVWQVLQALRAHDDRFNASINKIELSKEKPGSIEVIGTPGGEGRGEGSGSGQLGINFPFEDWRDAIYAKIVQKCGDRKYWETWASNIAEIADHLTARIKVALEQPSSSGGRAFKKFLKELRADLNPAITADEAVEMLSQHLITRPVFEALFGDYDFATQNPVSQTMQRMLDSLGTEALEKEAETLEGFYEDVRSRVSGVDTDEGRQRIITELYENFFRNAFPRTHERLGIVYTPIEVVDFILRSVDHVLSKHLDSGLGQEGVQILDPFTGTGTFIVRLLRSGLIAPENLERAFQRELHANELVLLAYYIAAINIEAAFHAEFGGDYQPFPGVVLTDTFNLAEEPTEIEAVMFPENHDRADRQKRQDIRVVVGNPPWKVGQASQNDSNRNVSYRALDARIKETYAERSEAQLQRNVYDSYIRAFRWASDRLGPVGVVGFVSNGYFIDGRSQDGMRKSLVDEFDHIYVLNLRGNQKGVQGDDSKREGGKVFASGSTAPVAITLLVRTGEGQRPGRIYYHDIGDYLSRETKLEKLAEFGDASGVEWSEIVADEVGDWINQRDASFEELTALGSKSKPPEQAVFEAYGHGLSTSRDAWVYGFDRGEVERNVRSMVSFFNAQAVDFTEHARAHSESKPKDLVDDFIDTSPTKISWSRALKGRLVRSESISIETEHFVLGAYRPFCKQWVYMDSALNEAMSNQTSAFPPKGPPNRTIVVTGPGARRDFSALIVDKVPNLHFADSGQAFPRYRYIPADSQASLLEDVGNDAFQRIDNISPVMVAKFREHYEDPSITSDDVFDYVYGALHSPTLKSEFRAELRKLLARVPLLDDFWRYADAGKQLASLHLGYEDVQPYALTEERTSGSNDDSELFKVKKMRLSTDRRRIVVNPHITLSDIPEAAYDYVVNGRSAIEWIVDRYQVREDPDSRILNDPNGYSDDPRYIVDLVRRVTTVSVESASIVAALARAESSTA